MKELFASFLISFSMLSTSVHAKDQKILCRNPARTLIIRVNVNRMKALVMPIAIGTRPTFEMPCIEGAGNVWLMCTDKMGRRFTLDRNGRSGNYPQCWGSGHMECVSND